MFYVFHQLTRLRIFMPFDIGDGGNAERFGDTSPTQHTFYALVIYEEHLRL